MYKPKYLIALVAIVFFGFFLYEALPESPKGRTVGHLEGMSDAANITSDMVVQFWRDDELFASRGTFVYRSRDNGITWEAVAKLGKRKGGLLRNLRHGIGRLKTIRKLRNETGIRSVLLLQDQTVLADYGGVYKGTLKEGQIVTLENTYNWEGGGPFPQGWTADDEGNVFAGEYVADKPGQPHKVVRLYCSDDTGDSWNICQAYERSEVRHIHSVSFDAFRNLVWLTTGDQDHECKVLYSSDRGTSFSLLGGGSQDWRIVSMQFSPDFIYWGTDSPGRWNQLIKWNWTTGEQEILLTVRNPFYFSAHDRYSSTFYFSTTVETIEADYPSSKFAEIWEVSDSAPPQRLLSWQKGSLDMWGRIQFAQGEAPPDTFAFTPLNLRGHHIEAIVIARNDNDNRHVNIRFLPE